MKCEKCGRELKSPDEIYQTVCNCPNNCKEGHKLCYPCYVEIGW